MSNKTSINSFCLPGRTIVISGEIDEGSFKSFTLALATLEAESSDPITIEIKSEGGSVYEALAIAGRMMQCPRKLITVGYGQVMSAAILILASGDERRISRFAWALHHEASSDAEGTIGSMVAQLQQHRREEEHFASIMADLTKMPKEFWTDLAEDEMYLTAEQCLQYGIVDKIV